MAKNKEESNPLLNTTNENNNDSNGSPTLSTQKLAGFSSPPPPPVPSKQPPIPLVAQPQVAEGYEWTAHGLPFGVVGQPVMDRGPWSSSLCSCLGPNDEFCSSDLEVCLLGSVAPCVLYGSNVERLGSGAGRFFNHCMTYAALYLIGNSFFGSNCLAPWFSYTNRTAIRRRFNLEGSCEALTRYSGCCGSFVEDDIQREQCETACDFATHVFCHPCSLCQEGREIRRRLAHPGFGTQPIMFMIPPREQTMGRE